MGVDRAYALVLGEIELTDDAALARWQTAHAPLLDVLGKRGRFRIVRSRFVFVVYEPAGVDPDFTTRILDAAGDTRAEIWCVPADESEALALSANELGERPCEAAASSNAYRAVERALHLTEDERLVLGVLDDGGDE